MGNAGHHNRFWYFHNSPKVLFSLTVVTLVCFSKVKRAPRFNTKCFWCGVGKTLPLSKRNRELKKIFVFTTHQCLNMFARIGFSIFFAICAILHESLLNLLAQKKNNFVEYFLYWSYFLSMWQYPVFTFVVYYPYSLHTINALW